MHLSNTKDDLKKLDNENDECRQSASHRDSGISLLNPTFCERTEEFHNYRPIEEVIKALLSYSVPQSSANSWSGTKSNDSNNSETSSNHLACLFDSHNIAHLGKNQNVMRDFIEDRGVSNIANYQGLLVDDRIGMIMACCCFITCQSQMPLVEARKVFKSCHHCFTYYCSAECRQQDWSNHKMTICPIGRAVSALKAVIKRLLSDDTDHNTFSNLGRGGYLRMGRGCIVLWFPSCLDAENFATFGSSHMDNNPVYVCIKNIHILISKFLPNSLSAVNEACNVYDPDKSMVISISIAVDGSLMKARPVKIRHSTIHAVKKCVTISLSKIFIDCLAKKSAFDQFRPTSLLLTMLPNQSNSELLNYKDRQLIFVNILRQLESRGVDLKKNYPYLYRNLIYFVERNKEFSPTTIYPTDTSTGRAFVCMIAPQSESIDFPNRNQDVASSRSSVGSFMAELDALTSNWEKCDITDL